MRLNKWMLVSTLLVSGCASAPKFVTPQFPMALAQDCPEPPAVFDTTGELADYALALRNSLRGCNLDKQAIREWATKK